MMPSAVTSDFLPSSRLSVLSAVTWKCSPNPSGPRKKTSYEKFALSANVFLQGLCSPYLSNDCVAIGTPNVYSLRLPASMMILLLR